MFCAVDVSVVDVSIIYHQSKEECLVAEDCEDRIEENEDRGWLLWKLRNNEF